MPESATFLPREHLLTFEEITRFVRVAAGLGINKIRLTGGEPLVRRDLPRLVSQVVAVDGITDIGLTTNGILLAELAGPLFDAGLRRLNVSLDTLDPDRFRALARRDGLDAVIRGIDSARSAGFAPIKVNAVALRGVNDGDIVPLARFCRDRGLELRFIESMPLDADHRWDRDRVVLAEEILDRLAGAFGPLGPVADPDPQAPAVDYVYRDGGGQVGVIASVSRPFCGGCNRLRLTAEGALRNCLFALEETDVRGLLRGGASDRELAEVLRASVAAKWAGHQINAVGFIQPARTMHAIGG